MTRDELARSIERAIGLARVRDEWEDGEEPDGEGADLVEPPTYDEADEAGDGE